MGVSTSTLVYGLKVLQVTQGRLRSFEFPPTSRACIYSF